MRCIKRELEICSVDIEIGECVECTSSSSMLCRAKFRDLAGGPAMLRRVRFRNLAGGLVTIWVELTRDIRGVVGRSRRS